MFIHVDEMDWDNVGLNNDITLNIKLHGMCANEKLQALQALQVLFYKPTIYCI